MLRQVTWGDCLIHILTKDLNILITLNHFYISHIVAIIDGVSDDALLNNGPG